MKNFRITALKAWAIVCALGVVAFGDRSALGTWATANGIVVAAWSTGKKPQSDGSDGGPSVAQ